MIFESILLPVLILLVMIPIAVFSYVSNNVKLYSFSQQFYSHPLPPQTKEIERSSEVYRVGNGNHCDFFVKRKVETNLTLEEIERYYQETKFKSVPYENGHQKDLPVWVDKEDNPLSDKNLLVTVSLGDIGHPAWLDIRCI